MPNIATWWCGQPAERAYVARNLARMTVGPALSPNLPFEIDATTAISGRFVGGAPQPDPGLDPGAWVAANGPNLVGQEAVTLSTTPVWTGKALAPRPLMLRVFAARTETGWQVMPGGYARVGRAADTTALSLRRGGSVADVWIVDDTTAPFRRVSQFMLPSRAADNLFWLGRYVERAEATIRLGRAYHLRLAEAGPGDARVGLMRRYLEQQGADPGDALPEALGRDLSRALRGAEKVRDRFSPDGWTSLSALNAAVSRPRAGIAPGDDAARALGLLLRGTAWFGGLVHDNMYRFTGWRFLAIGRALERARTMALLLATFAAPSSPEGSFDVAVEVGDSVMTHRRRYLIETNRNTVIDLLALDPGNPRSVRFQISAIRDLVVHLPGAEVNGALSPLSRAGRRTETALATGDPTTMDTAALGTLVSDIDAISDLLTRSYLV